MFSWNLIENCLISQRGVVPKGALLWGEGEGAMWEVFIRVSRTGRRGMRGIALLRKTRYSSFPVSIAAKFQNRENVAFVCVMSLCPYHLWFREGFEGYQRSLTSSHFLHACSLSFTKCLSPFLTVQNWLAELLPERFPNTPVFRRNLCTAGRSHWALNIRTQTLPWVECATPFAPMAPDGELPTWASGIWSCQPFCFAVHAHRSTLIRQTANSACSVYQQLTSDILMFALFLTLTFY